MKSKKSLILFLVSVSFVLLPFQMGMAEDFPTKHITLYVPLPAGGATDFVYRTLAEASRKYLNNQPVIIENRVGGGTTLNTALISKAKPDGYSISASTQSGMVFVPYFRKVNYNPRTDFVFICKLGQFPQPIVVRKDHPANSWQEWIKWAKENPGKATYTTAGPQSPQHIIMAQIFSQSNIKLAHIPMAGTEALSSVMGGHVSVALDGLGMVYIKSGQVKCLAVANDKRLPSLPNVPTLKELGYRDLNSNIWFGIIAPAKTPPAIVKKLEEAFAKASNDETYIKTMKQRDYVIEFQGSDSFTKLALNDIESFGKIFKDLNIEKQ